MRVFVGHLGLAFRIRGKYKVCFCWFIAHKSGHIFLLITTKQMAEMKCLGALYFHFISTFLPQQCCYTYSAILRPRPPNVGFTTSFWCTMSKHYPRNYQTRKIHCGFWSTWTQQGRTPIFATPAVRETIFGIFVGHWG